jgi:NAD(P)-dependent dehydrogenase (short-subunit alcohol dehydrogenase family)
MAHVRAAHALLPAWLERGSGRFVSTVSAAGLLTMIGAAPYSVTKHGALAFAEWLSLTYRHRGIKVHAICPQGVRTDMLAATGSAGDLVLQPTAIEPEDVADALFKGMAEDRFLILPHSEVAGYYQARATDPDRWLTNMNHIQRKWEETR